ncbi:Fungal Zn(2)-Cys(6) binuclear cluster domain [Ceratobasidium sp. AG-Ba]|nr:Fungal Zn(2)-Cys(6) binuclear cluster domain [Ceratobasidium sp. AG-Ba]
MIESFLNGTAAQTLPGCINWLTRFGKELDLRAESNPNPARLLDRLLSALQVTFLKLKLVDGLHAYKLLKQSAPAFLRIASAEIGLGLSPQNIIVSDHYELGQFMLLDSLCAMIYAIPQIIQYDISDPSLLQPSFSPNEWVHGCPVILQLALVDINSLLDRKRAGCVVDWKALEYRLISWQPASSQISGDNEPHKRVTYFATQECWRHTLLIYLLMVM